MLNTRIDPIAIDVLQAALGSLKNRKDCSVGLTDSIWELPVHDKNTYVTNDDKFLEAMFSLHQLREARSTLSLMLASLDHKFKLLRSATRPAVLARGIEALPDEVLAHILVLAGAPRWIMALRLSWVSQRFRSIALSTPTLWTTLPHPLVDDKGRELMGHFFDRSKNIGLSVELPLMITRRARQNPDWDAGLAMLMDQKHRWKELNVDLAAIFYFEYEDRQGNPLQLPEIRTLGFPEATLDSVEHLYIGDSPRRFLWPGYGSAYEFEDASFGFYSCWKFPNLTTLVSDMHFPPAGVFPSLTEFSLDISLHAPYTTDPDHPRYVEEPLGNLVDFLNSVPTLQTFKLTTGEYSWGPISNTINLPCLTTLCFENHYAHPESLFLLRTVSEALLIPAVETISVDVRVTDSHELAGRKGKAWLSSLFPNALTFKKLKRFRLEYAVDNDLASKAVMGIKHFPALEELQISTSSAPTIRDSTDFGKNTSLKHVQFQDMHLEHETVVREYTFEDGFPSYRLYHA